jgi:phosphoketolase
MTTDALTLERKTDALTPKLLRKMHAYWRAANYLSVCEDSGSRRADAHRPVMR